MEETIYFDLWFQRDEFTLTGRRAAVCRHDSRNMKQRAHIFNQVCEAEWGSESDMLALARPHFQNLPNSSTS